MSDFKWAGNEIDQQIAEIEKAAYRIQDSKLRASTLALAASLKRNRETQAALAEIACKERIAQKQQERKKFLGLF
jgi:hypothetical protein